MVKARNMKSDDDGVAIGRIEPKTVAVSPDDVNDDGTVAESATEVESTSGLPAPSDVEDTIECIDCDQVGTLGEYGFDPLHKLSSDWGVLICPGCGVGFDVRQKSNWQDAQ